MNREAIKTLIAELRADLKAIERLMEQLDALRQDIPRDQAPSFQ